MCHVVRPNTCVTPLRSKVVWDLFGYGVFVKGKGGGGDRGSADGQEGQLMDSNLVNDSTCHNLQRQSMIKGLWVSF